MIFFNKNVRPKNHNCARTTP